MLFEQPRGYTLRAEGAFGDTPENWLQHLPALYLRSEEIADGGPGMLSRRILIAVCAVPKLLTSPTLSPDMPALSAGNTKEICTEGPSVLLVEDVTDTDRVVALFPDVVIDSERRCQIRFVAHESASLAKIVEASERAMSNFRNLPALLSSPSGVGVEGWDISRESKS